MSIHLFPYTMFLVMGVLCDDYKEAPIHGDDNGIEYKVACPYKGAMTGIKYRSTVTVDQIEFICMSSMGNSTLGPYGGGQGEVGLAHCPPQHYISSFYGTNTTTLSFLGIRCRHQSDMYSDGKPEGEFGEENGTHFDELALSIGARPVLLTVYAKNNEKVNAIQVTYTNISNMQDGDNYSSYGSYERFGSSKGDFHEVVCPKDGAIISIEYIPTFNKIYHLTFECASALGYEKKGPFGWGPSREWKAKNGYYLRCDKGQHIGHISVTANSLINSLQGACVPSGVAKGDSRPVKIIVWSEEYVNGIDVKYDNMAVEYKCKETSIQLADDIQPELDGYEVLGIVSGSTCSALEQQLCLTVLNNEGSTSTDVSSNTILKGYMSGSSFVTSVGAWFFPYPGAGINANAGSTNENKNGTVMSHTNSSSDNRENSAKTTISYQGPGAAILVGYRTNYRIKKENVAVKYHYTCEAGSKPPRSDTMSVTFQLFENVYFQDYHYPFESKEECTSDVRDCISNIKFDKYIYHPQLLDIRLKTELDTCLGRKPGNFTSNKSNNKKL